MLFESMVAAWFTCEEVRQLGNRWMCGADSQCV